MLLRYLIPTKLTAKMSGRSGHVRFDFSKTKIARFGFKLGLIHRLAGAGARSKPPQVRICRKKLLVTSTDSAPCKNCRNSVFSEWCAAMMTIGEIENWISDAQPATRLIRLSHFFVQKHKVGNSKSNPHQARHSPPAFDQFPLIRSTQRNSPRA